MAVDTEEWDMLCYVDPSPHAQVQPYALLVLNYPIRDSVNFRNLWRRAAHRVAADGGANHLVPFLESLDPPQLDAVVGDLDSVTPRMHEYFAHRASPPQFIHDDDDDATDFAKSVEYIRSRWPDMRIAVLGGLGGRVDQGLSVMHHMYKLQRRPQHRMDLVLIGEGNVTVLLPVGKHSLRVRRGAEQDARIHALERRSGGANGAARRKEEDGGAIAAIDSTRSLGQRTDPCPRRTHVGIVPLKGKAVITTQGLRWDVQSWETEMGGRVSTNNLVAKGVEVVHVETTAEVLFTAHLYDDDE